MRNLIIFLLLALFLGCNKIELPEKGKDKEKEEQQDDNKDNNDEIQPEEKPDQPSEEESAFTIAEALRLEHNETICIKGFIVGYIASNSIEAGARFDLPDAENTNMLIADSPHENQHKKCMAVKLEKTGNYATRAKLNLYDNPELFKTKIIITADIGPYFSKNGILRIYNYCFPESNEDGNNDNNGGNEGDNNGEDNGNEGDNNIPSDGIDEPTIDDDPNLIPDGRNKKKKVFL